MIKNTLDFTYFDNGDAKNAYVQYQSDRHDTLYIFIPNWQAKSHHWMSFCIELTKSGDVIYFETREKANTQFEKDKICLDNHKASMDIIRFINAQKTDDYVLILCSYSCALVMEHWYQIKVKPRSLVLICPFIKIRMPALVHIFANMPESLLSTLSKAIFLTAQYSNTLKYMCKNLKSTFDHNAIHELKKLQLSIKAVLKARLNPEQLATIDCPKLLILSKKDNVHRISDFKIISQYLNNHKHFEVHDFKQAHHGNTAERINLFISELNNWNNYNHQK